MNRIVIVVENTGTGYRTKVEDNLFSSPWVAMPTRYPEPMVEVVRHAMAENPSVRQILEEGIASPCQASLNGKAINLAEWMGGQAAAIQNAQLEATLPAASPGPSKPRF